jgi:hypothetical protein
MKISGHAIVGASALLLTGLALASTKAPKQSYRSPKLPSRLTKPDLDSEWMSRTIYDFES